MPFYSEVHFVCHLGVVPWSLAAARPGAQGLSKHTNTQERLANTSLPSQLRAGAPAHGRHHAVPGLRNSAADSPEATDSLGHELDAFGAVTGQADSDSRPGHCFLSQNWRSHDDNGRRVDRSTCGRGPEGLTTIDLIFTNAHNI